MKIWDKVTGECMAEIITDHSMSIDDVVELMGWHVNTPEDERDNGVWTEDLEMDVYDSDSYEAYKSYVDYLCD